MVVKKKRRRKRIAPRPKPVVWKGPEVDGITQSLLSRFLVCRERFRILVQEGLQPEPKFSPGIEYGQLWHTCEEAIASGNDWKEELLAYTKDLLQRFPMEQEQVEKWYHVCKVQFPIFLEYWSKNKEVRTRQNLLSEETFRVPYQLPSGRTVILRGKWDSVDLIGKGKLSRIYLQENKTKGLINEDIGRQLTFDLQTMMYLIALGIYQRENNWMIDIPIEGVRYNVIRRPLSGGKGTIRQHKPTKKNPQGESKHDFYKRLEGVIKEEPDYYFYRWTVGITQQDIQNFKDTFFDACLEHLCLWYESVVEKNRTKKRMDYLHYRHPYGVYNSLMEGRGSDVEEYLMTGNTVGLQKVDQLFPELD